jgi:hypothetical protein
VLKYIIFLEHIANIQLFSSETVNVTKKNAFI